jgi:RNA polymerase sigma-70 factor (family 1)
VAVKLHQDETLLLQQVATGNEAAFRQLFDLYWDNIYSVALVFIKSPHLAEEIVQDVFVKLWEKRKYLPSIKQFDNYIFIVTRNHVFNVLRSKISEITFTTELEEYFLAAAENADQTLLAKESQQLIDAAVAQLPEQQRRVFSLTRKEGMSQEKIAEALGISKLTVKKHMNLALQSIRAYLGRHASDSILLVALIELLLRPRH